MKILHCSWQADNDYKAQNSSGIREKNSRCIYLQVLENSSTITQAVGTLKKLNSSWQVPSIVNIPILNIYISFPCHSAYSVVESHPWDSAISNIETLFSAC